MESEVPAAIIELPVITGPTPFSKAGDVPKEFTRTHNTNHCCLLRPIPVDMTFKYGTAGFRTREDFMPFIVYRTAVFTGFRARTLKKTMGIMITASHNPCGDNGVKIVDPSGEMLAEDMEEGLTEWINMSDEEFKEKVRKMAKKVAKKSGKPVDLYVHIGWDTRKSSPTLALAAIRGVEQTGVATVAHGQITTPQLHYIVRATSDTNYGPTTSLTFRFVEAVDAFFDSIRFVNGMARQWAHYSNRVFVDCANGVGAYWVETYTTSGNYYVVDAVALNADVGGDKLNNECGADYVKLEQKLPRGFEALPLGVRCASLDGDADRLVYFAKNSNFPYKFHLMDGDHIAALFAKFVLEHMNALGLLGKFTFGVVQTAYSNGNSTKYFKETLNCQVICAKTGVKYLQNEAKKFDVAVYFEANGHGTVHLSDNFTQFMRECKHRLINEVVGDGIADLLAVELILRYYDWSLEMWEERTFSAAPSQQLKINVKDRSLYSTADHVETILTKPSGMQAQINSIVAKYAGARAFVRPSGTEDAIRIYAEAQTEKHAKALAAQLEQICTV